MSLLHTSLPNADIKKLPLSNLTTKRALAHFSRMYTQTWRLMVVSGSCTIITPYGYDRLNQNNDQRAHIAMCRKHRAYI